MRFFPVGAFTATSALVAHAPIAQIRLPSQIQLLQQVQQLQQQFQQQQLQQFQQQLWPQIGAPIMGNQVAAAATVPMGQMQAQSLAVQADLRIEPLRMDRQLANQALYQGGMGEFGRPVF
jgi:hypothetical protein